MEKTAGSHSEEERVRGRCVSRERGRGGRQGEEDREASKESRREDCIYNDLLYTQTWCNKRRPVTDQLVLTTRVRRDHEWRTLNESDVRGVDRGRYEKVGRAEGETLIRA